MLVRLATLERIVAGEIDLQFRRQRRPTVKAGGTLKTSMGVLAITAVDRVAPSKLTAQDAHRAGYGTVAELKRDIDLKAEGDLYRIEVRYAGEDPRIALREHAELTDDELTAVLARLARLDKASARGPWTQTVLELIAANPARRAPDLAESLGLETQPFKTDVRKLKSLGLTESLTVGYRISPRGQTVLTAIKAKPNSRE